MKRIVYDASTGSTREENVVQPQPPLPELKAQYKELFALAKEDWVNSEYPLRKKIEDNNDTETWGAMLLDMRPDLDASTVRREIVAAVRRIRSGSSTLEKELSSFSGTEYIAREQLLKAALRNAFLMDVKLLLRRYVNLVDTCSSAQELEDLHKKFLAELHSIKNSYK